MKYFTDGEVNPCHRWSMCCHIVVSFLCLALLPAAAQKSTHLPEPPAQHQPAWWRNEGVVIAGSWEPLFSRLRGGGGSQDYEQIMTAWRREHSEEIARRLKDLGF